MYRRRLGLITATVTVIVLVAAVVVATLLWQCTGLPDTNPDASAAPSASQQHAEGPIPNQAGSR